MKSNNTIKVSIIIPCYNRAQIVSRAISSALSQTYQNTEILIVDDGSDDGDELVQLIAQLSDARIKLIRHNINRNGAAARNTGIRHSNGEFVAFLDSDDEWRPEKIEKQLALLNYDSTRKHLAYCASTVITEIDGLRKVSKMPEVAIGQNQSVGDYLFCNRGYIPTPSMILPRWLAEKCLFNEKFTRHQDYDFLLKLEKIGCEFLMHEEALLLVHWEDLQSSARGLNPQFSMEFMLFHKQNLSRSASSGFVFRQIVMRLVKNGRKLESLKYIFLHVNVFYIGMANIVDFISWLLFSDDRITKLAVNVKKKQVIKNNISQ